LSPEPIRWTKTILVPRGDQRAENPSCSLIVRAVWRLRTSMVKVVRRSFSPSGDQSGAQPRPSSNRERQE